MSKGIWDGAVKNTQVLRHNFYSQKSDFLKEKKITQVTIMQGKVKFIFKTFHGRSCRRTSVGNS